MQACESDNLMRRLQVRRMRGFTIIEVLVTVAILIALVGITVVGLGSARRAGRLATTNSFMQALVTGLEGFEQDHDFLPESSVHTKAQYNTSFMYDTADPWYGAEIMTQALMGYAQDDSSPPKALDHHPAWVGGSGGGGGYGAKKLNRGNYTYGPTGRTVGPYVELKSDDSLIKTYEENGADVTDRYAFSSPANNNGAPILYFRRDRNPNMTTARDALWGRNTAAASGDRYAYNLLDNHKDSGTRSSSKLPPAPAGESDPDAFTRGQSDKAFEYLQSQWDARDTATGNDPTDPDWPNHEITALETSFKSAEYMLIAPGEDGLFGGTVGGDNHDDIVITGR